MKISSKDNRYIRLYRELGRKKFRSQYGLFPAEGKRLIEDLIDGGLKPQLLLYRESFSDIAFLEKICPHADQVFCVEDRLFDRLSDTRNDQGLLATFPCFCPDIDTFVPSENSLILILNRISDPGNLGTILRCAAAAGVEAVLIEEGSVDLYNPKVIRGTMGSVARVPVFDGLSREKICLFCEKNQIRIFLSDLENALCYDKLPVDEKIAVVFGNEGSGIDEQWHKKIRDSVMIPMENGVESLNVAMASAVICFDHQRKRRKNLK